MSMSMELLIAAVAVGIALLMAVCVPIAMEPIPPAVELITILDCISILSALSQRTDRLDSTGLAALDTQRVRGFVISSCLW